MLWPAASGVMLARSITGGWQAVERIKGDTAELDSVVVRSPLPGGVARVVRFLFNLPAWFQIAGFIAGLIIAGVVVVLLWHRRRRIVAWFLHRSRAALVGLGAAAVVVLTAAALAANVSWNYTQHNNNFCVACHVMTDAYTRFQTSAHCTLQCHDCHEQSIFASMMQVYYWVAERPQSIPAHAKVPTAVCARCHIQGPASKTWQRVIATAGHSVHLRSDDPRLRNVQCVTCHGTELHRFLPVESTCGQSGCHAGITVELGKMRNQTTLHCVTCHPFTTPVVEHLSPDSAARALAPAMQQCLDCHAMRQAMASFNPVADPHKGQCGWCHDPHVQTTPAAAFTTCTNAGCHASADTLTAMHRGLPHHTLANCGACHAAHTWKVEATACLRCHSNIFRTPAHPAVPAPARTARAAGAASDVAAIPVARRPAGRANPWWWRSIVWVARRVIPRGAPPLMMVATTAPDDTVRRGLPGGAIVRVAMAATDTLPPFSHQVHRSIACAACHNSTEQHGSITVRSLHDCQACHHAVTQQRTCAQCHASDSVARRAMVAVMMRTSVRSVTETRRLPFLHQQHEAIECRTCHTQPVTLAARSCSNCHADHHRVEARCLDCHDPAPTWHDRAAHTGCGGSGCHTNAAVLALPPTRNVCLVCHAQQVTHYPARECTTCHGASWTVAQEPEGGRS